MYVYFTTNYLEYPETGKPEDLQVWDWRQRILRGDDQVELLPVKGWVITTNALHLAVPLLQVKPPTVGGSTYRYDNIITYVKKIGSSNNSIFQNFV